MLLFSPGQRAVSRINSDISNLRKEEFNLAKLHKENQILSEKLSNFEAKKHILFELARENERLKELLEFKGNFSLDLLPAQVIGRDATNWNKIIFINKGSRDGVMKNFPVITPEGLAGEVIEVTSKQSKVMTILDSNCRVAALVKPSRTQGIISGTNNFFCELRYISLREEVGEGNIVISSGQGGIFPKGLIIGAVSSVKKKETDLFQSIRVDPAVNFSRLEEVMVIIGEK